MMAHGHMCTYDALYILSIGPRPSVLVICTQQEVCFPGYKLSNILSSVSIVLGSCLVSTKLHKPTPSRPHSIP